MTKLDNVLVVVSAHLRSDTFESRISLKPVYLSDLQGRKYIAELYTVCSENSGHFTGEFPGGLPLNIQLTSGDQTAST